jgi:hypothetical protein
MATATKDVVTSKVMDTAAAAAEHGAAISVQNETVKAMIKQRVEENLRNALQGPKPEIADPLGWWDIFGFGPFVLGATTVPPGSLAGSPLLPHQVIRAGETAYVGTVIILNPVGPAAPSATDILSNFSLPFQVEYRTGNLTNWTAGPASMQANNAGTLVPGVSVYVDVMSFTAQPQDEGLYEMNISARILGCGGDYAPSFSAFATYVYDFDEDYLGSLLGTGGPGFYHKNPIRFQVYR